MPKTDPLELLNQAVNTVRSAGHECAGWTMQANDDGYVAWLFDENDEGQTSLFEHVEVVSTAEAAARWVLAQAQDLAGDGVG